MIFLFNQKIIRKLQKECGPLALARSLLLLKKDVTFGDMSGQFKSRSENGVLLSEIVNIGKCYVNETNLVHFSDKKKLINISLPAILLVIK
jgi:hypothetical protein